MGFLGSVSRLGKQIVRPHDIARDRDQALTLDAGGPASAGVIEAVVEHVVRLALEVQVDLRADSGEGSAAEITRRDTAELLQLSRGETVFARVDQHSSIVDRVVVAAV